ncbi:MAG: hypothetical protein RIS92_3225 [Verrucomicrobiota bacterium]|jgi:hypothetical protein
MNLDRKSGVGFVLAVGVWAGLISGVVAVSQGVPEPVKVITGAGNNEVKPANVLPPDESEKETLKKYQASEWAGRFFRKALAPYGEWMDVQKLGQVWRPKVEKGWSPYSVGDWVYTDLGWVWTGDEPFASIVYHYGRWARTKELGWVWVPGLDWSGGWVSFRYGANYVGWSPLPPSVEWEENRGVGVWVDKLGGLGPDHYRFCSVSNFGAEKIREKFIPVSGNAEAMRSTVNVTNIVRLGKTVAVTGLSHEIVSARSHFSVVPVPLRKEPNLRRFRELLSGVEGYPTVRRDGSVFLLAPEWRQFVDSGKAVKMGFDLEEEKVVKAGNDPRWLEGKEAPADVAADAKKAQEKKEVTVTVFSGWESVVGEGERKLRAKVAREVSGLDPVSFPAKQPSADDLPRF